VAKAAIILEKIRPTDIDSLIEFKYKTPTKIGSITTIPINKPICDLFMMKPIIFH
jgi:hypothetical protein